MEFNPLDFAIHIVNIVILFLILRAFLYKPVRKFMRDREEKLVSAARDAANASAEAEKLRLQYAEKLTAAENEAHAIVRESSNKASADADEILAKAKLEAAKITDEAKAQAVIDRRKAVDGMKKEIGELAVELSGKILSREVTAEDNKKVIDEFFKSV